MDGFESLERRSLAFGGCSCLHVFIIGGSGWHVGTLAAKQRGRGGRQAGQGRAAG